MRSGFPARLAVLTLCTLAALASGGCSEKVTAPNSRPVPEGQQNGVMLMMGWHEQESVWFTILDPGTPTVPTDDVLGVVGVDYWADPAGVRTTTLDLSQSNQLEPFRLGSDGNVNPLFDFLIPATVRFIGSNFDSYDFEDFAPTPDPKYYARGVLNGQVTVASPVSNRAGAFPTSAFNMNFIPAPKGAPGDSVLDIQFEDDPGAAYYVVEVSGATGVLGTGDVYSLERRTIGIPSPLLPGSRPIRSFFFLMPAGSGLAGIHIRFSTRAFPLFFHIRVTAIDAQGRMVNRVNDYLRTRTTGAGTNTATYEPLGGAVEVLDPYPDPVDPVDPPDVLTADEAYAILFQHAGSPQNGVVTRLGGSVVPPATSLSPGFLEALDQLQANPAFSKAALEQRFRAIREKLGP
jgi:hypothetical protein